MRKSILLLLSIGIILTTACASPMPSLVEPPTALEPVPTTITSEQMSEYETVSFALEGNGEYMFAIYLKKEQIIHLTWFVKEGDRVWFHILTPSGNKLGFYENGQYADGTLSEGSCQGFTEGITIFSPSDYGWSEGYYQMFVTSYSPSPSEVEVQYWIEDRVSPTPSSTYSPPSSSVITSSGISREPSTYDGQEVELSGQIYMTHSAARLLIDGKSGINIAGNTASLQKGFYRLKGLYDAGINTLNVTEVVKEEVEYNTLEIGKELGINLIPISVWGLVATPPKEVANTLTSYLSIPNFPKDVLVYPYIVYAQDGFYLTLSDTLIDLPAKFTFLYQGRDYSFTFSTGEVKGALIKTPLEKINVGLKWASEEFGGVIIASTVTPLEAVEATVEELNTNPGNFMFKRVAIDGSYMFTTATVDYSEIKAPMGQGILSDEFSGFFKEDTKARLETIDPNTRV